MAIPARLRMKKYRIALRLKNNLPNETHRIIKSDPLYPKQKLGLDFLFGKIKKLYPQKQKQLLLDLEKRHKKESSKTVRLRMKKHRILQRLKHHIPQKNVRGKNNPDYIKQKLGLDILFKKRRMPIKLRTKEQQQKYKNDCSKKTYKKNLDEFFATHKIDEMDRRMKSVYCTYTKFCFDNILPKVCEECGSTSDLHIHHKVYRYPSQLEDLARLCSHCHALVHWGLQELTSKETRRFMNKVRTITRTIHKKLHLEHCEKCGTNINLQIHHKRYRLPIQKEDILTLCNKCHMKIHTKLSRTTLSDIDIEYRERVTT